MAATASGFVQAVRREIGVPYVWGGASPAGFDCSGLVKWALTRLGVAGVPRTSEEQYAWANPIEAANVQPGDLVFLNFPGERSPGHVAIYSKPGYVIQAPKPGQAVQEVPFSPKPAGSSEWGGVVVGYGRVPGLAYPASSSAGGGRPRPLPPRPGNPNNPGGAADPGKAAGDAAAAAWDDYAAELSPPGDSGPTARYADLNVFGFGIPGTGWVPSFGFDPFGSLGGWNPLHVFEQAGDAVHGVEELAHWIAWIFSPRNILRVVEFLAGAGLIIVGLSFSRRAGQSADRPQSSRLRNAARNATFAVAPELAVAGAAAKGRQAARQARRTSTAARNTKRAKQARTAAQAAARQPSETRAGHKARRARERQEGKVPF